MSLEKSQLTNHIEALLFLSGEPMTISRLAKILGKKEREIKKALEELEKQLQNRGIRLIRKNFEALLGTAPESSSCCQFLIKDEIFQTISRAGLETLAIILYKERVGRNEIDNIRGVNSGFVLHNLMIRGLIERKINPRDKRTFIYSPSILLWQHLGITKKEELPDYDKFKEKLNINN